MQHHGGSVTDLRVNYTTDTKYREVASQKLREQLISLKKTLRFLGVIRDKIVCESLERVDYTRY